MLALGAIAATLPYSALKIAWLAGSRIGLSGSSFGTSTTMHVLNAVTLGLDVVAFALAVTFFRRARAPRWFVLPTMWVGYGLLGQILAIIGPSVFVQVLSGSADSGGSSEPIAGWVYLCVYAGFSGLGLCLLPAFAIYAWQRWGAAAGWGERLKTVRAQQIPVTPTALVVFVVLSSCLRAAFSNSGEEAVGWAVAAVVGLVALAGVLASYTGWPGGVRRVVPLLAVWTASGAMAAWGVYQVVLETVPNDLVTETVSGVDVALAAVKVVAGMAVALVVIPRIVGSNHEQ